MTPETTSMQGGGSTRGAGSMQGAGPAAGESPSDEPVGAGAVVRDGRPLLTICIPTYNRAAFIEGLVAHLIANVLEVRGAEVELIVVDNRSTDGAGARLAAFSHPQLRVVTREVHFDTAEENIIRSLSFVRGEYVWFLGDDDAPSPVAMEHLLPILREGRRDCLIFNSPVVSPEGAMVLSQPLPMNAPEFAADIGTVIESVGLLFTFAGVSNVVQRTACLNEQRGLYWMGVSKIYSHVAWIAEANLHSDVVLLNMGLVLYRQNDYSDGHWERVAERNNVQDRYNWTLGLARLLNALVAADVLSFAQVGGIQEISATGDRYRLMDDMLFKTYQQLTIWRTRRIARERFDREALNELCGLFLRCDASCVLLVQLLRTARDEIEHDPRAADANAEKREEEFVRLFQARRSAGAYLARFVGVVHGFEVFRMPIGFVAIRRGDAKLRDKILDRVDPTPDGADVLVDRDYARLTGALKEARERSPPRLDILPFAETPEVRVEAPQGRTVVVTDDKAERLVQQLSGEVRALRSSSSWRLTAPLRSVAGGLKRLRTRPA